MAIVYNSVYEQYSYMTTYVAKKSEHPIGYVCNPEHRIKGGSNIISHKIHEIVIRTLKQMYTCTMDIRIRINGWSCTFAFFPKDLKNKTNLNVDFQ